MPVISHIKPLRKSCGPIQFHHKYPLIFQVGQTALKQLVPGHFSVGWISENHVKCFRRRLQEFIDIRFNDNRPGRVYPLNIAFKNGQRHRVIFNKLHALGAPAKRFNADTADPGVKITYCTTRPWLEPLKQGLADPCLRGPDVPITRFAELQSLVPARDNCGCDIEPSAIKSKTTFSRYCRPSPSEFSSKITR